VGTAKGERRRSVFGDRNVPSARAAGGLIDTAEARNIFLSMKFPPRAPKRTGLPVTLRIRKREACQREREEWTWWLLIEPLEPSDGGWWLKILFYSQASRLCIMSRVSHGCANTPTSSVTTRTPWPLLGIGCLLGLGHPGPCLLTNAEAKRGLFRGLFLERIFTHERIKTVVGSGLSCIPQRQETRICVSILARGRPLLKG
jgi:hypothetical protein